MVPASLEPIVSVLAGREQAYRELCIGHRLIPNYRTVLSHSGVEVWSFYWGVMENSKLLFGPSPLRSVTSFVVGREF